MDSRYWSERLERERQRLESSLQRLERRNREDLASFTMELSRYDNHPGDLGSEAHESTKDRRFLIRTQQAMEEVREAQTRLVQGTFGFCQQCGKPIESERLELIPHARFCSSCQRDREVATLGPDYNPQTAPPEELTDTEPGGEPPLSP